MQRERERRTLSPAMATLSSSRRFCASALALIDALAVSAVKTGPCEEDGGARSSNSSTAGAGVLEGGRRSCSSGVEVVSERVWLRERGRERVRTIVSEEVRVRPAAERLKRGRVERGGNCMGCCGVNRAVQMK